MSSAPTSSSTCGFRKELIQIGGRHAALAGKIMVSLLETPIYEHVQHQAGVTDENTKLAAANAAMCLLEHLVQKSNRWMVYNDGEDGWFGMELRPPQEQHYQVGLASLAGLVAFVESEELTVFDLLSWPMDNDAIVHDPPHHGGLFNHQSSDKKLLSANTKKVETMMSRWKGKSNTSVPFESVEEGISLLVDAMVTKGVAHAPEGKQNGVELMSRVYGVSRLSFQPTTSTTVSCSSSRAQADLREKRLKALEKRKAAEDDTKKKPAVKKQTDEGEDE